MQQTDTKTSIPARTAARRGFDQKNKLDCQINQEYILHWNDTNVDDLIP